MRLEQLYPFPAAELTAALRRYPRATEFAWVQEEPANQGAWTFVRWRIEALLGRAPAPLHRPRGGREPGHRQLQDPPGRGAGDRGAALKRPRAGRAARAVTVAGPSPTATARIAAMTVEVRIPQLGESVTEGVIARWLKHDGDVVQADEPLLELETDKATMEIPAGPRGACRSSSRRAPRCASGTVVARIAKARRPATRAERHSGGRAPASRRPPSAPADRHRARRPTRR